MIKNFTFGCLLLTALPFIATAQFAQKKSINPDKTNQVDADWQNAAQAYIAAGEYHFKQASGKYFAANKKQRTGAVITSAGFTLTPLLTGEKDEKHSWSVDMQLIYIGKGKANMNMPSNDQPFSSTGKNNFTVRHSGFDIEYINTEEGLRQNFVINNKPAGDKALSVMMQLSGNLVPSVSNNELQLKDESGTTKLFYRDLKVWDANQQPLAANMQMGKNGQLQIIVDDSKAVYPVTIDPINQTPEWTDQCEWYITNIDWAACCGCCIWFFCCGPG
ncbi:MAG: hypothetical protein QM737_07965 [Ferruginibacter sp.]